MTDCRPLVGISSQALKVRWATVNATFVDHDKPALSGAPVSGRSPHASDGYQLILFDR
jgi:hypothetical protein